MKQIKTLTKVIGCLGLTSTIILLLYIFFNLGTIFSTPKTDGQGDYYDLSPYHGHDLSVSLTGILFLLLPLLLLFWLWMKLFVKILWKKSRDAYYGLFIAGNTVFKIVSVILTIMNVASICFLAYKTELGASEICDCIKRNVDTCPDNSLSYLGYILGLISIWGGINLVYGLYGIISRKYDGN